MRPKAIVVTFSILGAISCGARVPRRFDPPPPRLSIDELEIADQSAKDKLVLLVFGDGGSGEKEQREAARRMKEVCDQRACDLALVLGDNIYEHGVRPPENGRVDPAFEVKFERAYAAFQRFDFWVVAGNHDWHRGQSSVDSEVRYTLASERWRMPAYDFAIPKLPDWLRIYGLDTTVLDKGRRIGQLERAREHLCSGSGWRLLFGHHAIYTGGRHGGLHGEIASMKRELLPLIEDCGVKLYLAGHDHHQEHLSGARFEQIIQGAAARLRRVRDRSDSEKQQRFAASKIGFALLEVTRERLDVFFYGFERGEPEIFGQLYTTGWDRMPDAPIGEPSLYRAPGRSMR